MTEIFWPAIVSMIVMYGAVFLVGVWASRGHPSKASEGEAALTELMLAGRSMPLWVAFLTMTATWVGGGYINGTAEFTFTSGLLWGAQPGLGYALALIVGGLVFAGVMRRHGFATLVDPLEARYGKRTAAALMVPAVLAEVIWSAAILVALGTTFGTILGLNAQISILLSSAVAIGYTVVGGLRSVAYTDVIQLGFIVVGLGLAVPFAVDLVGGWSNLIAPNMESLGTKDPLTTLSSTREILYYGDLTILLILGGIPWNVYFQRVLSSRTPTIAGMQSIFAGFMCAAFAVPPIILGLAAAGIDWTVVANPQIAESLSNNPTNVLPYLLAYAMPPWVGVIALGAVSAAVMSSVDSSILSASSLVAWNGYRRLLNPAATSEQVTRLVRYLVIGLGAVATVMAITVGSVKDLWYLCGDVVYCVLFPQLTLALFDPRANRTGALTGFATSILLRMAGGIAVLGIPAIGLYPNWGPDTDFPFRTVAMLSGLTASVVVSRLTASWDAPQALRNLSESPQAAEGS